MELVRDGSFEPQPNAWTIGGTGARTDGRGYPNTGIGHAYFSENGADGYIYQPIAIPTGAPPPQLTYYLNITSNEGNQRAYDHLYVEVRSATGALLSTVARYSNVDQQTVAGRYTMRGPFDLSAYRGMTIRLQFRTSTDDTVTTQFRLEDVSLK